MFSATATHSRGLLACVTVFQGGTSGGHKRDGGSTFEREFYPFSTIERSVPFFLCFFLIKSLRKLIFLTSGSSKIDLPQYQSTMNGHDAPSDIVPSHATKHFTDSELSDEVFQDIWALGEPLVVTGLLSKFKIEWTPEFFIKTYGSERCFIFECETEVIKPITVGEFFSTFGKERKGGGCWKLKV